ncbi:hypothetical protein Chor_003698 [Crotalus horridus]
MEVLGSGAELSLPPDLKDLEMKLGQKPPDGLIRWLRGDPAAHLLRNSPNRGPRHGLGEKIKALKVELMKQTQPYWLGGRFLVLSELGIFLWTSSPDGPC